MYFIVKKCHVQYQILQPSPPQAVPPAPGGENGTVGGCVIKGYACNAGYVKWQGKCTKECAANNTEDTKYVRQQDGSCKKCDTGTVPFSSFADTIEPQECKPACSEWAVLWTNDETEIEELTPTGT